MSMCTESQCEICCRDTIERVQEALAELEKKVSATDRSCADSVRGLRDDMVASVSSIREQRDRTEAVVAELRGIVHDAEKAATGKVDSLQTQLQVHVLPACCALRACCCEAHTTNGSTIQCCLNELLLVSSQPDDQPAAIISMNTHCVCVEVVRNGVCITLLYVQEEVSRVTAELQQLREQQAVNKRELEDAAAAAKASRDSDLEIIERALTAAHTNHELVCSAAGMHTLLGSVRAHGRSMCTPSPWQCNASWSKLVTANDSTSVCRVTRCCSPRLQA